MAERRPTKRPKAVGFVILRITGHSFPDVDVDTEIREGETVLQAIARAAGATPPAKRVTSKPVEPKRKGAARG